MSASDPSLFQLEASPAKTVAEPLSDVAGVARVQLEGSAVMELDYAIPERFISRLVVGTRVMVPLQNQRQPAVVMAILESSPHQHR